MLSVADLDMQMAVPSRELHESCYRLRKILHKGGGCVGREVVGCNVVVVVVVVVVLFVALFPTRILPG